MIRSAVGNSTNSINLANTLTTNAGLLLSVSNNPNNPSNDANGTNLLNQQMSNSNANLSLEKRKQHSCPFCDRSFTRPYRLNDHISFSHTDEVCVFVMFASCFFFAFNL